MTSVILKTGQGHCWHTWHTQSKVPLNCYHDVNHVVVVASRCWVAISIMIWVQRKSELWPTTGHSDLQSYWTIWGHFAFWLQNMPTVVDRRQTEPCSNIFKTMVWKLCNFQHQYETWDKPKYELFFSHEMKANPISAP